jgi:uncharacterized protein YndB with AHSA1/START domain
MSLPESQAKETAKETRNRQALRVRSGTTAKSRAGPFKAFVFGHNLKFSWAWGDHGDPAPAPQSEPGPGVEVLSDTPSSMNIGSSAAASTFSPNVSETTETTETSREQRSEERLFGSTQQAPYTPKSDEDQEGSIPEATGASRSHRLHIHDNVPFVCRPGQPSLRHERRRVQKWARLALSLL